jgi:hypothetical protein
VNECLKDLEELELEIAYDNGGSFEKFNPITAQYKALCNSIYNLC